MKKLLFAIITLTILVVFAQGSAFSADTVSCGSILTSNTTLTSDLTCSSDALIIGASKITLNLSGFTLTGPATNTGAVGVLVDGYDRVTIKNGSIQNFETGVSILNGSRNTVTGLNIDSCGTAISILDSSSNRIKNNRLTFNELHGVILGSSSNTPALTTNNIVERNLTNWNYNGFVVFGIGNTLRSNQAIDNWHIGYWLWPNADHNVLKNNYATGHGLDGIFVYSDYNTIEKKLVLRQCACWNWCCR